MILNGLWNFLEDIPYAMNEAFTEITNEMDELRD